MTIAPKTVDLDALAERINAVAEWADDYNLNNEDCPTAEFVSSLFYGEIDPSEVIRNLKDTASDDMDDLWSVLESRFGDDKKSMVRFMADHASLERHGIYITENELCSASLGEIEEQLDDDITSQLESLTDSERDALQRKLDCYLSGDCIYIDLSYDRWVLVLDIESLTESLESE